MKKIKLSNSKLSTLVDDEDYPVLSRLNWYISDMGYAITDSPVKHLKMHKLLIGPIPPKTVIDHIDRNKLNNCKQNLRVVTQAVNMRNSDRYENAKHMWFDKRRNIWVVEFRELGINYIPAKDPTIAERIVKRIKLGFPKELAVTEANNPTISISNWKRSGINYEDYILAMQEGTTVGRKRKKLKAKLMTTSKKVVSN